MDRQYIKHNSSRRKKTGPEKERKYLLQHSKMKSCIGILSAFTYSSGTKDRTSYLSLFLEAFTKLRKATISVVMSIRLSVRTEQRGSHWTDFHEI
jgi:hypothetical protein